MISVKKALSIIRQNTNLNPSTENIKSTLSVGRITAEKSTIRTTGIGRFGPAQGGAGAAARIGTTFKVQPHQS